MKVFADNTAKIPYITKVKIWIWILKMVQDNEKMLVTCIFSIFSFSLNVFSKAFLQAADNIYVRKGLLHKTNRYIYSPHNDVDSKQLWFTAQLYK